MGGGTVRRSGGGSTLYSVVMMKDSTGAVSFEAIPCSEVSKREKALQEDYVQACKAYKEVKKENPNEPKPVKPAFVVKDRMLKKEKADAIVAKLREQYDEYLAKKQGNGEKPFADEKPKEDTGAEAKEGKEKKEG